MVKRLSYYLTVFILELYLAERISQEVARSLGHKLKLRGFHNG
jgi:hypothetical protein